MQFAGSCSATDRGRAQCTEVFGEFVSHELLAGRQRRFWNPFGPDP